MLFYKSWRLITPRAPLNNPMITVILILFFIALFFGPSLWVKYVLAKHNRVLDGMPGNARELAQHLLNQFDLQDVKLEPAQEGRDHYDPQDNAVRLSPSYMDRKSLTAIAVAAHEVGHAIQFNRKEPVSFLRRRYLPKVVTVQKIAAFVLMAFPLIGGLTKMPHLVMLNIGLGIFVMLLSVLLYVAILPEEYDASFNKALPILEKGEYLPEAYMPAVRQILKACALTYVAAALADVLKLWRWIRYLR